jgi:hypothetical protein
MKPFTHEQLRKLRSAYSKITMIDIGGESYRKACIRLDSMPDLQLLQIAGHNINMLTEMARNRCITRGLL